MKTMDYRVKPTYHTHACHLYIMIYSIFFNSTIYLTFTIYYVLAKIKAHNIVIQVNIYKTTLSFIKEISHLA
jgi:hypothetical protein